ncbi:hypothetical protein D0865_09419 [Hortaea werneckii]|uniref:Uncharacterized protein n=1 Tax=Hortaea werneckii TaxID=91943 RepID=A0A3M7C2E5_HORWE|nr:hypothetical protein D0865_09419 [Hortaea werneckii]
MSKASSSPTARLLQSSRLFSLPRPLPQPHIENITSTGVYRASDSATLPYPTHQAIATTASSQSRGDWGLKRALPKKAIQDTSTPHIRVSAQDTPEHITDFGSAADHTQTQAKWNEMGIPILVKTKATRGENEKQVPQSVFENHLDNTTLQDGQSDINSKQRWKFNGPWIAGMQEGDFDLYTQQLASRKGEWKQFLRSQVVEQRLSERRRMAQEAGEILSLQDIARLRDELLPNDAELEEAEKKMRDAYSQDGLSSELTALIAQFLDLPAVRPDTSDHQPAMETREFQRLMNQLNFNSSKESTPPSTHPSAGLSYLRTDAVMENHPIHGPQAHRSPILSRVVRPRNAVNGTDHQAKLGVGGIVTNDPITAQLSARPATRGPNNQSPTEYDPNAMASTLDPDLEGGNKMWVHPRHAYIDQDGRIRLTVDRGRDEAVAVKRDDVQHIHDARAAATRGGLHAQRTPPPPGTRDNPNFGFSTRRPQQQQQGVAEQQQQMQQTQQKAGGVQGFDQELGRQGQEGQMEDGAAMAKIRELIDQRR